MALELLEDRTVPASFTAATVPDLIADINAANLAGGSNTITLAAGKTFTLTAGELGVAANNNLTILGNGDTIERSTAVGTPAFRLFDVQFGASLRLDNLTLQGGIADINVCGSGGGIYSSGTLSLNTVTVQNNAAYSTSAFYNGLSYLDAVPARGGGIYSSGSLTMTGCKVLNNQAVGEPAGGLFGYPLVSYPGMGGGVYVAGGTAALKGVTLIGNIAEGAAGGAWDDGWVDEYGVWQSLWLTTDGAAGCGGGLYVAGGAVTLSSVAASSNTAQGGNGGGDNAYGGYFFGGNGYGGGLYAAAGTVTLLNCTVSGNTAKGGAGGKGKPNGLAGVGIGGALYIDAALVYLDTYTVAHIKNNRADNYAGVFGSWVAF